MTPDGVGGPRVAAEGGRRATLNSAEQVVFVLQVIVAVGPLAVYFLGLGLVNSQPRPCLVAARSDFVVLAVAFVPVVVLPISLLVEHRQYGIAAVGIAVFAGLFWGNLPTRRGDWVIYNVGHAQFRRLLHRACRRLGWSLREVDDELHASPAHLAIGYAMLPWLRNVSLRLRSLDGAPRRAAQAELIAALHAEIRRESTLPSTMGASLVLVGTALLGVPMWDLLHHMDAIVDVVRRILVA